MSMYLSGNNEIRWPHTVGFVISMFFGIVFATVAMRGTLIIASDIFMWLVALVYFCVAAACYQRGIRGRIYPTYRRVARRLSTRRTKREVLQVVKRIITSPVNHRRESAAYEVAATNGIVWTICWWSGEKIPTLARFEEGGIYKTYILDNDGLSILMDSLHTKPDLSIEECVQRHIDFDAPDDLIFATPLEIAELLQELRGLRGCPVKRVA